MNDDEFVKLIEVLSNINEQIKDLKQELEKVKSDVGKLQKNIQEVDSRTFMFRRMG